MALNEQILPPGHREMLVRVCDDLATARAIMDELEPQGIDFSKEREENAQLDSAAKGFLRSFYGVEK